MATAMRSARMKILILAALVGIWALIFGLHRPDEPVGTSLPPQTGARPVRTVAGPSANIPRLKAELVNLPRAPYPSEVQNIFSVPPPPPPPPPQVLTAPGATQPAPPPPDPFQEEAKQLRYVGFLRSGGPVPGRGQAAPVRRVSAVGRRAHGVHRPGAGGAYRAGRRSAVRTFSRRRGAGGECAPHLSLRRQAGPSRSLGSGDGDRGSGTAASSRPARPQRAAMRAAGVGQRLTRFHLGEAQS